MEYIDETETLTTKYEWWCALCGAHGYTESVGDRAMVVAKHCRSEEHRRLVFTEEGSGSREAEMRVKFSAILRRAFEEESLVVSVAAEDLNVHANSVHGWLKHDGPWPSVHNLVVLCEYIGVDMCKLVEEMKS
jgi:hypothetical protein